MINENSEFHPKIYILKDTDQNIVASTGSTNLTYSTRTNFEWDTIQLGWVEEEKERL